MKHLSLTVLLSTILGVSGAAAAQSDPLNRLLDGNRRFATAQATHPHQTAARRGEVGSSQKPYAVIVGCADSRVPPEVVFDQGLGDLFVVRVAGQVVDDTALGSIEFAVAKLGARLIVVLGHERCGAVEAALAGNPVPGHISSLVDAIKPGIHGAAAAPGDALDNAVGDNVRAVVDRLRRSEPILAALVRDGSLRIVGAVYDLDTGIAQVVEGAKQP